jgi:hypothetical protein
VNCVRSINFRGPVMIGTRRAHRHQKHHERRYIGAEKQSPTITLGSVHEAMHAAEAKLTDTWRDIVRSWERTR